MKRITFLAALAAGLMLARGEAAETLTPAEARALAKEAYIFGAPLVANYRTMFFHAVDKMSPEYRAPFNTFVHVGRGYGPADAAVSPNNDTIPSFAWLDLRRQPVVLTVPKFAKGRYYSITLVDLFTFNFANIGTRVNGPVNGGNYLITGPNWKGKTPGGITRTYASETQFALVILRTQMFGPGDLENLRLLQQEFRIQPLNVFLKKSPPPPAPAIQFPGYSRSRAEGIDFIGYLNFVLQFCAPHPSEKELLARLAKIGVGPGRFFDSRNLSPEISIAMNAGIEDAVDEADRAIPKIRNLYQLYGSRAVMKGKYFNRFLGARIGLYTADWEETLYLPIGADSEGLPLDGKGGMKYVLEFPPGKLPPVNGFWSLSLYDGRTKSFYANAFNRYTINSSLPPAPVADANGGVTIYVQHDPPGPGLEANWLPAPDGPFYLTLRLYWPKPIALEGRWTAPVPKKVTLAVAPPAEIPFNPPFVRSSPTPAPSFGSAPGPRTAPPFVQDEKTPPSSSATPVPEARAIPVARPAPSVSTVPQGTPVPSTPPFVQESGTR